jgi:hypothetical protein
MIADDLRRYGEEKAAAWIATCSEDELVRVCSVAYWLLFHGPGGRSGASMMIAKACALAAVYVREGRPRDLARSRRSPASADPRSRGSSPSGGRRPDPQVQANAPPEYGVGQDARDFWGHDR